ncbi:hypothetical protein HYV88_02205 [Candidatus Woesearchaeota archaeon]|nr:hypothetical protein [Candidatus Woesearchaeota archaeon]
MEIKNQYAVLSKKYKLPSWKELDNEFELLYFTSLVEISHVLRFIRRRINDRVSMFIHNLQGFLQPNPGSPISLEEANFLDEEEKKKVAVILRELMNLERRNSLLDLNFDEKKDAEFINDAVKRWFELKKDISKIINKVKKGWESKVKEYSKEEYFG